MGAELSVLILVIKDYTTTQDYSYSSNTLAMELELCGYTIQGWYKYPSVVSGDYTLSQYEHVMLIMYHEQGTYDVMQYIFE